MILLIDNYDSFVHNLARYFSRLGQTTHVVRNDAVGVDEIVRLSPDAIVFSPGPCSPNEAGASLEIVTALHAKFPMLGVCLGHQTIAAAFGADIVRGSQPMHGRTSRITTDQTGIFANLPKEFDVCRYHSLQIEPASMPAAMQVSATTADGVIMGIRHRELPVIGVQFHPEAILTEYGYEMLAAFLTIAGLTPQSIETNDERIPAPDRGSDMPTNIYNL